MDGTDLKFFTNEPERDLYSRFTAILKSGTQYFDILVGYFRTSGFFKLYTALENVEKIRVLVGLNVDRQTIRLVNQSHYETLQTSISHQDISGYVKETVEKEFEAVEPNEDVEKGVRTFIDWLKSGKIEMRMYTEASIHAKVYIMRKNPSIIPDTFGSVITGSSNFSVSGLMNNLEFNVELKDAPDVKFALKKFESIWDKSVDIRFAYEEAVEQQTWMRNNITPYQIYLKTLYEYFKEEINLDKDNYYFLLPEGYMRLQYQIDAVIQARQKLDAYNGVFISDVVGLGKTYICAMLANTFSRNAYKLFICPPVLVDYWKSVLQEFGVSRYDVESLGKLDKIVARGAEKYTYIFIDEAHRFRNSDTESFTLLHQICRQKKVILISATPINNYTSDIENQLYLFQPKNNGTINGVKNIELFFRNLNHNLSGLCKGTPEYIKQLRINSTIIRDRLLREVMIRRTRTEIEQYYKNDLKLQGLSFPKVGAPGKIIYMFDADTDEAFNETMGVIRNFKYARYTPLLYLKDSSKYSTMLAAQKNMGGFMKSILVKRLESSFYAFRCTLDRFVESYEKFIKMVDSGEIYISKKVNVYDLLDDGNTEKLLQFIEQNDVMKFKGEEFMPKFIKDLKNDLKQLKYLQRIWSNIIVDPKLDEFRSNLLNNQYMIGKKIIVFTESKETADYLHKSLIELFDDRVVSFSGQSSQALKSEIEDSFNPKNSGHNNDKYDILITTDVLSEGINLHRANVLINYDLPWNPTKIMQRVGRINRVGTSFDEIFVFNFFPTAQTHNQLPIEDRILEKLQAFHDTLGGDIKYLSDSEEVSSKKLFEDLNNNLDCYDDEDSNSELAYLNIIRHVRDTQPELFKIIKCLPKNVKIGRDFTDIQSSSTITFFRNGALKTFFVSSSPNGDAKQIPLVDAIKFLECTPEEPRSTIQRLFYDEYKNNIISFEHFLFADEEVSTSKKTIVGNDAKVLKYLKAIRKISTLTDDQDLYVEKLIKLWEQGEVPSKVSKDIIKIAKRTSDGIKLLYEISKIVPNSYLEPVNLQQVITDDKYQIILSCFISKNSTQ